MNSGRVLVVEDERIIALEIVERLENLGFYDSTIVSSGEKALLQARELEPVLIFMDIGLKGKIDGIETARRIRAEQQTPIIYLTAYADEKTIEKAKTISDPLIYLLKPFSEDELRFAIDAALNNQAISET
ncbi:MAG: response regulator [bacterium]|nr:response regulator [bacterium]